MSPKFAIAVCQMKSTDSVEKNFDQIVSLLDQIEENEKIELACFPENSLYMRIVEGEKIQGLELNDPIFSKLARIAQQKKMSLHLGSIPLKENSTLSNASVLVSSNGQIKCTYKKLHLFDIELEGVAPVRESDVYTHGAEPQMLVLNGWHFGQTICYDLRFSELFNWYAQHSVEVILVPASFLVKTGQAHWEILLRARAIESQAYVVAAAQAGEHTSTNGQGKRDTFGNSLVVDPWGTIVAKAESSGPEVLKVNLDLNRIQAVRSQIPMKTHRRLVKMKR